MDWPSTALQDAEGEWLMAACFGAGHLLHQASRSMKTEPGEELDVDLVLAGLDNLLGRLTDALRTAAEHPDVDQQGASLLEDLRQRFANDRMHVNEVWAAGR